MEAVLKEIATEMHNAFTELRDYVKRHDEELAKNGHALAQTMQKIDEINKALDQMEARWKEIRRERIASKQLDREKSELEKVFWKALRNIPLTQEERQQLTSVRYQVKSDLGTKDFMITANDVTGGYVCPPEFVAEVIEGIREISPVRQFATVRQTDRNAVIIPKKTPTLVAGWVGEMSGTVTAQAQSWGAEQIVPQTMYAKVEVSTEDLQDPFIDLERSIREEIENGFAYVEGEAFIKGTTPMRPEGITTNSQVFANRVQTTGSGNTLSVTDLFTAAYGKLKRDYARRGVWLVKRSMVGKIRQMTAGSGTSWVWQPQFALDAPATILGMPYAETPDLDDDGATKKNILIVGDLARAYTIVDRVGMEVLPNPYVRERAMQYNFFRRVGGQVVLPEAVVLVRTPES